MPKVEQQDHAVIGGIVPHFVLVGIIEHDALALGPPERRAREDR